MIFRARDAIHFLTMSARSWRRQRRWQQRYERAIRDGSHRLDTPSVLQIIPTEACNLRCAMCNQWGDNGYFRAGVRPVDHMDPDGLTTLLESVSPVDTFISIHGGEPFAYKHTARMLEVLARRPYDVMFSTNGTLLSRHLDGLAEIDNLSFLLSIDGDESTHDAIRGKGRYRQAKEAMAELFEARRRRGKPLPLVVVSFVVCEHNDGMIERMPAVAQDFGGFVLNYNMRWFLTEDVGESYERHLQRVFGLRSTGAWRGWISEHAGHNFRSTAKALAKRMRWPRLTPPYLVTTPSQLRGDDFMRYFSDYLEVFGNESCFMPYYWARVHANGQLIFCPGHPDLIAGNVLTDGLYRAFNSPAAIDFRKHMLENRMPICNRCCGLYMTNMARPRERASRRKLGLSRSVSFEID